MLNRLQASLADRYRIERQWGWIAYLMHRNDEAEARIRQTLDLDPNYAQAQFRLGLVQIQQHRYPEAIASIRRSIALGVFYPQGAAALAFAYGVSGDRAAAISIVSDLRRRSARELVPPFMIAVAYAGLGDPIRGIEWLNRGSTNGTYISRRISSTRSWIRCGATQASTR